MDISKETNEKKKQAKIIKAVFITIGVICVVLGAVGVALPILPTTPFLIVAAFCFAKSSERLNNWFRQTRLYKAHLETLSRKEGMTWPAKLRIIAVVTIVMGIAEFFMLRAYLTKGSHGALIGVIIMAVVWIAHIIAFCFIVKTCSMERAREIANEQLTLEGTDHDAK